MGSAKRPAELDFEITKRKKVRRVDLIISLTISHVTTRQQVQEITLISPDTSRGK